MLFDENTFIFFLYFQIDTYSKIKKSCKCSTAVHTTQKSNPRQQIKDQKKKTLKVNILEFTFFSKFRRNVVQQRTHFFSSFD